MHETCVCTYDKSGSQIAQTLHTRDEIFLMVLEIDLSQNVPVLGDRKAGDNFSNWKNEM